MTSPAGPMPSRRPPMWRTAPGQRILALVAVLLCIVFLVASVVYVNQDNNSTTSTGTSTTIAAGGETFGALKDDVGADPFSATVTPAPAVTSSTIPAATVPAATVAATQHTVESGGTPGLYGGTRSQVSCDREKMISFLTANPAKAAAWARVEGIPTDQVASYIRSLTPVVLRADTRVTNHGYQNGVATAHQSVLQAGTAVLIDAYGVPRARCACGNPLLPPASAVPHYAGRYWPGFLPGGVVTVQPATTKLTVVVLVDVTKGGSFGRKVGTPDGDGPVPPSTTTTMAGGTTTTMAGETTTTTLATTGSPGSRYRLHFTHGVFAGDNTPDLDPVACANTTPADSVVSIVISGDAVTVDDGTTYTGVYNPSTGQFSASRTTKYAYEYRETIAGTISSGGAVSGSYVQAPTAANATCTVPFMGRRV